MASHAIAAKLMPIAPIAQHTQHFEAGDLSIGVEYRVLNNDIVDLTAAKQGQSRDDGIDYDDRGVSLHVYAKNDAGESEERLRFDCFDEDPHYHYIDWSAQTNHIVQIDPVADGDPLAWALDRIRTRLAPMLARAGAPQAAGTLAIATVESLMPRVTEAAYRARYHHDDSATLEAALA